MTVIRGIGIYIVQYLCIETMKQNPVIMATIVAIGLLTLTTTATNVQASGFKDLGRDLGNALEDLGNGIDDASANYKQGYADGERAGVRGGSSECQSSDGVYCVGYNTGYGVGQDHQT